MRDLGQSHHLRGLRGEGRAPALAAVKNEFLATRKNRFVIGTFWINPKFKHAAGHVQRTRDFPFALQLAKVTQIHDDDIRIFAALNGVWRGDRCDLGFGASN